jgi:hypothetical protein
MVDISPFTLIVLSLAAFRITRLVIEDVIFESVREKIWKKFPPSTKFGYLLTCYWCLGLWVSVVVFGCYLLAPSITFVVSLVLSISTIIGIISSRID